MDALVILDVFPPTGPAPAAPTGQEKAAELERMVLDTRREAEAMLGEVTDEELAAFARVFLNDADLKAEQEYRPFDGDALLLVADQGREPEEFGAQDWRPYVTGELSEARIPCRHSDMVRPEMLAPVRRAVAEWLAERGR